jgi:hypothetical protein
MRRSHHLWHERVMSDLCRSARCGARLTLTSPRGAIVKQARYRSSPPVRLTSNTSFKYEHFNIHGFPHDQTSLARTYHRLSVSSSLSSDSRTVIQTNATLFYPPPLLVSSPVSPLAKVNSSSIRSLPVVRFLPQDLDCLATHRFPRLATRRAS